MSYFDDVDREMEYMQSLEREFSDIFSSADDLLREEQKKLHSAFKEEKESFYEEANKNAGYVPFSMMEDSTIQTLDCAYTNVEYMIG